MGFQGYKNAAVQELRGKGNQEHGTQERKGKREGKQADDLDKKLSLVPKPFGIGKPLR